ncbi:aquaporin-like protein [Spiromyces aspiralis]|uniref:Aquaporin-like protein n=1 Tax=Spiromyces aspiralis TaxID=68401 RepID=A0ACC1HD10_9FUNG|nr:aquaporin-like protein [Spiromyces aspiralis]
MSIPLYDNPDASPARLSPPVPTQQKFYVDEQEVAAPHIHSVSGIPPSEATAQQLPLTTKDLGTEEYVPRRRIDAQGILGHYLSGRNMPLYEARRVFADYFAEFFGTMVLIIFGDGVVAMSKFNSSVSTASYLPITFGWGIGLTCALYISMGVSGGHLNPAVTLSFAIFGKFPIRKVPGYILAQILGAIVGAACVFGLYHAQFQMFDGGHRQVTGDQGTGGIFFTLPNEYNSRAQSAFSEILNTALLLGVIQGINDPRMTPANGYKPVAIGLLVFAIGTCTGWVTGYAINPARDLGPRMFASMVGYGKAPFTVYNHYFLIPMFCPIVGAVIGVFLYEFFIVPVEQ